MKALAYALMVRDDQVLLQLRQGTGFMDGYWSAAAAGHVEPGESAAAAAVREASEELGVLIQPTDLRLLTVSSRHQNHHGSAKTYEDHFFVARNWSGTPVIQEPQRAAELRWFGTGKLPSMTVPHELVALGRLVGSE